MLSLVCAQDYLPCLWQIFGSKTDEEATKALRSWTEGVLQYNNKTNHETEKGEPKDDDGEEQTDYSKPGIENQETGNGEPKGDGEQTNPKAANGIQINEKNPNKKKMNEREVENVEAAQA